MADPPDATLPMLVIAGSKGLAYRPAIVERRDIKKSLYVLVAMPSLWYQHGEEPGADAVATHFT